MSPSFRVILIKSVKTSEFFWKKSSWWTSRESNPSPFSIWPCKLHAAATSSYLTGERSCLRPCCRFSPARESDSAPAPLSPLPLSLYRGNVYKTIQDFVPRGSPRPRASLSCASRGRFPMRSAASRRSLPRSDRSLCTVR